MNIGDLIRRVLNGDKLKRYELEDMTEAELIQFCRALEYYTNKQNGLLYDVFGNPIDTIFDK